jgi:hypothetical protein
VATRLHAKISPSEQPKSRVWQFSDGKLPERRFSAGPYSNLSQGCCRYPRVLTWALDGARDVDAPIAVPHSPQNFSPGWMAAPHFGQVAMRAVPQFVQNFLPTLLSPPHFEQHMFPLMND